MASIKKDKSGQWGFVFDAPAGADGKRRQVRRRGFRTKDEAKNALRDCETDAKAGLAPARGAPLLSAYLEDWLADVAGRVSPKTVEGYQRIVHNHLSPALGQTRLERLTPAMLQAYIREKLDSDLSPQTVLHHYRCVFGALEAAVRLQLVPRNAARSVRPPRVPRKQPRALTREQVIDILALIQDTSLYLPALIAVGTGMREAEILALAWRDVDLDRAVVALSASLSDTRSQGLVRKSPKTGAGRLIVMPAFLIAPLRLQRTLSGGEWVCPREDGQLLSPTLFANRWRRQMQKIGLDYTFHELRHTHATAALELGIHPKVVSERLGHSRVGVTLDTYSHVTPSMQQDAAERLDRLYRTPAGDDSERV